MLAFAKKLITRVNETKDVRAWLLGVLRVEFLTEYKNPSLNF